VGRGGAEMKRLIVFAVLCISLPAFADRTLIDDVGRSVTVTDHPHRVICLMPNLVDDVYALGGGADIVAVTDYAKYPPEAKAKPSVGLPLSPSLETIVSLHPDLVLASGDLNRAETVKELEKLKVPVFAVTAQGMEGLYQSIMSVGRALNREAAAAALVATLREREGRVRARVAGKPVVNVLMAVWYDPIVTIGKSAYITDLIAIAGGHSVTADIPEEWPQISLEAVLARAPEGLLLKRESKMSIETLRSRPGWATMAAVKNNRVYYVDDRIELPSPVAFEALEDLAQQFHP
jgi:ABC-type Fe3+-hydroxamate transport system substrate-binding protein